jgi:hypothetical protein
MKKIVANAVLMMTFVFLLTAVGYSQQPLLKADVPFEFTVGKKTFPAGEYNVIRVASHTLTLRDSENGVLATFVTEPVSSGISRENPKLKFAVVNGEYVLTQVWPDGAANGYELLARGKKINYVAQTATSTYVGK